MSDDYLNEHETKRQPQWKVGVSSIFARALEILPYKDTFWTTSNQSGNPLYKSKSCLFTSGKLSLVPPRRYRLNGCDRYPELPVMVKN